MTLQLVILVKTFIHNGFNEVSVDFWEILIVFEALLRNTALLHEVKDLLLVFILKIKFLQLVSKMILTVLSVRDIKVNNQFSSFFKHLKSNFFDFFDIGVLADNVSTVLNKVHSKNIYY